MLNSYTHMATVGVNGLTSHVAVCVCHAKLKGYLFTYLLCSEWNDIIMCRGNVTLPHQDYLLYHLVVWDFGCRSSTERSQA